MRITILILAILGAVCSLLLGMKWSGDLSDHKVELEQARASFESGAGGQAGTDLVKELDKAGTTSKMLMVAAALAIGGAVLVMKNMALPAAAILAVAGILPVIVTPKTLLTTAFILIAAVLAFLSSRKPAGARIPVTA